MNINRVIITGNLTRNPETRPLPSGNSVTELGIAVNGRRKNSQTQEWEEFPNFFNVTVWGAQGENCAKYLEKGRPVAIDGRLQWRSWEDKETGAKRSAVDIVAESVQFLGSPSDGGGNGQSRADTPSGDYERAPVATGGSGVDDDIPFHSEPFALDFDLFHAHSNR